MSIFPKRTIAGGSVTIHWNLTLPATRKQAICPFVRIGITDPAGKTTLLLEDHVLVLPSTAAPAPEAMQANNPLLYLHKNTPLLVLASYLSGKQSREKLTAILNNLQNGRHYYFTWAVPPDALPGKYLLCSEMHIDGITKYSGTAAEDFFYVEQLSISAGTNGLVTITNHASEPLPVKLIHYDKHDDACPRAIEVFHIPALGTCQVAMDTAIIFLVYNEERITIPLHALQQKRVVRNQQYLSLHKEEAGEAITYVLPKEGDDAYRLSGVQRTIWAAANGMTSNEELRKINSGLYDEMLASGLIKEII